MHLTIVEGSMPGIDFIHYSSTFCLYTGMCLCFIRRYFDNSYPNIRDCSDRKGEAE